MGRSTHKPTRTDRAHHARDQCGWYGRFGRCVGYRAGNEVGGTSASSDQRRLRSFLLHDDRAASHTLDRHGHRLETSKSLELSF